MPSVPRGRARLRTAALSVAGLLLALASLASLASLDWLTPARATPALAPAAPCVFEPARHVTPVTVAKGQEVTFTLALAARCDPNDRPLHLVLVVDASDQMGKEALGQLTTALRDAVTELDMPSLPYLRVGVVTIADGGAQVRSFLTADPARVLNALPSKGDASGTACVHCGLADALRVLRNGRSGRDADELREAILLATVGIDQSGCDALRSSAGELKAYGALVVTACVGRSCEQRCLSEAASQEQFAFRSWDWGFTRQRVTELVRSSGPTFHPIDSTQIEDWLSDSMMYTGGGYPSQGVGNHLIWRFSPWPEIGISLTYHARSEACGRFRTSRQTPAAAVLFNKTFWAKVTPSPIAFDNPILVVPCPTATVTPAVSASPSTSPTASSTPLAGPGPTAAVTPAPKAERLPYRAFLPQALSLGCAGEWAKLDVILAMDVSGSMMRVDPSTAGESRREVARTVAGAMVERLRPGWDRAAVVVYGDEELMQVLAPLADCCAAVRLALERLPRYNGSRMDLAVDAAVGELTGPAARADAAKVLVVATDGDLNQTPVESLRASAAAARQSGTTIHVLVVGDAIDGNRPRDAAWLELLAEVTGARGRVYSTRYVPAAAIPALMAPAPRCWR